MDRNQPKVSAGGSIIFLSVLVNTLVLRAGFTGDGSWYNALIITLPFLLLAIFSAQQKKQDRYENTTHFIKRRRQSADILY